MPAADGEDAPNRGETVNAGGAGNTREVANRGERNQPTWNQIVIEFDTIIALPDQTEKEFSLIEIANKYGMEFDTVEKLFALYEENTTLRHLESRRVFRAFAKLERGLHLLHRRLTMLSIFPLLEQVAKLSIIAATVLFLTECRQRGREGRSHLIGTHYAAWNVINGHDANTPSSGGRTEAIEFLSEEGQDLSGINLSQAWLTGIRLNPHLLPNLWPMPRFLGANFEGARINNGDLRHVNLTFANFKNSVFFYDNPPGKGFEHANLSRANFAGADLEGVSFKGTDLRCTSFVDAKFLNFSQVTASAVIKGDETWKLAIFAPSTADAGATIRPPQRTRIDLFSLQRDRRNAASASSNPPWQTEAETRNFTCYGFLKDHVSREQKDQWLKNLKERFTALRKRRKNNFASADFRYAYLDNHDLSFLQLRGANLQDAYLNSANLTNANLDGANLQSVKKLTCPQLKQALNWRKAVFTPARREGDLYMPLNPIDNQNVIEHWDRQCKHG
ncbi:MAG: pentapeptide repeat-containing protein [Cyanobacteriota bacterium]|nr:pentapeptide repeat-containing protein [Cyanobacteriota bacterium]